MSSVMQKNGNFLIKNGEMLASEGDKPVSLKLLLQGKLDVYTTPAEKKPPKLFEELKQNSYKLFSLDQNLFIGVNDIISGGGNNLSIAAAADSSLFAYAAENELELWSVIHNQKDYGSYVINSLCSLISNSYSALRKAYSYCMSVESIYSRLGAFYISLAAGHDIDAIPGNFADTGMAALSSMKEESIMVPPYFSKQFIEAQQPVIRDEFAPESAIQDKATYFLHLSELPADLKKSFFGLDQYITDSHIKDASACLNRILEMLRQLLGKMETILSSLYNERADCAYMILLETAKVLNSKGLDGSPAINASTYIYEKLKEIAAYLEFEYNHKIDIDFKYFEHYHINSLASLNPAKPGAGEASSVPVEADCQSLPEELKDSAKKIIEYSEIPAETAAKFMLNLTAFRNLRNRLSTDEAAKKIRSAVSETFFSIYEAVFKKACQTKDESRLIRMFLSFGYMDERLLSTEQTLAIYNLAGRENAGTAYSVYYMKDWLTKIIKMEKDPSINQFGQDYFDVFRELKRHGKACDEDKPAYVNDANGRLAFEIHNMFATNHKLCQGQILSYFPILHRDAAPENPFRAHVTPSLIAEKLNRILEIDYSAFHREINYRNPALNIEKEIVMMQVLPEFILMPVYGTRAVMWQELTGRARNTPGRFLLPVFTNENLDDMLLKLVGNFRWELCRTMMGAAWNDVTQSSLTSDYTDYIQFYRKNRDLTDEAKEKVKAQISKYHNRMREIFTSDYELWVNFEAKGNSRLNKVARAILFKHCPFSRPIRDQLERQPMYADMVNLMRNQRAKLVRELESRYNRYAKAGGALDPVLDENLFFYRNL